MLGSLPCASYLAVVAFITRCQNPETMKVPPHHTATLPAKARVVQSSARWPPGSCDSGTGRHLEVVVSQVYTD